jgi:hypothetical protein
VNIRRTATPALFTVLALAGAFACDSGRVTQFAGSQITVQVSPPAAQVSPGSSVGFRAAVTGTANTAVSWTVSEAGGGTVDAAGLYLSPQTLGTYHVMATSVADPSVSGSAAVTVTPTPTVAVSVFPGTASVAVGGTLTFSATVTGTSNTTVTWAVQEGAAGGSITPTGLYTAPATPGTYHVSATSAADPTKSDVAAVTVTATPPPPPAGACATAPLRSTGTIYYYCDCGAGAGPGCAPGNDSNPGTSPSAPRRSWANAVNRFNSMNAGDTVAFCRTGAWSAGGLGPQNGNCSGGSQGWPAPADSTVTCDMRDYIPSWGDSSSSRPILNGLTWSFGGSTGGYRFWNLDAPSGGGTDGIDIWDPAHHIDFCNVRLFSNSAGACGAGIYATMPPAPGPFAFRQGQIMHWGFDGWLGAVYDALLDGNYWENNGQTVCGDDVHYHQAYMITSASLGGLNTRMAWRNNEFSSDSTCGGVMLVVHGRTYGLTLENNYIHNSSGDGNCYGIQFAYSAEAGEFRDATVRRNRVSVNGQTGIEMSCCTSNCIVDDNIVIGGSPGIGGANDSSGCYSTSTGTFRNNSIYGGGIRTSSGGGNWIVENNAVHQSGSACYSLGGSMASGHPFTVTNYPSTAQNTAGNYCVSNGAAPSVIWVDAPNGNFKPANPGPLVGTANQTYYSPTAIGTVTWSPTDSGQPRTPPVDIGAYQR